MPLLENDCGCVFRAQTDGPNEDLHCDCHVDPSFRLDASRSIGKGIYIGKGISVRPIPPISTSKGKKTLRLRKHPSQLGWKHINLTGDYLAYDLVRFLKEPNTFQPN
jgi:hypothetical protein